MTEPVRTILYGACGFTDEEPVATVIDLLKTSEVTLYGERVRVLEVEHVEGEPPWGVGDPAWYAGRPRPLLPDHVRAALLDQDAMTFRREQMDGGSSRRTDYAPRMTIGADDLPGLAKMAEEAGELVQVVAKLISTNGRAKHWDGSDLHERLVDEAGDLLASIRYFAEANGVEADLERRADRKLRRFRRWHEEAQHGRCGAASKDVQC